MQDEGVLELIRRHTRSGGLLFNLARSSQAPVEVGSPRQGVVASLEEGDMPTLKPEHEVALRCRVRNARLRIPVRLPRWQR